MIAHDYECGTVFDEMLAPDMKVRDNYESMFAKISSLGIQELIQRNHAAERAFVSMGVTFNVYKENKGIEQIFPFDIIPRIIDAGEWARIEAGLRQRITALNLFLNDIYGAKHILKDGVIEKEIVYSSSGYLPPCEGFEPPHKKWCHIAGIDLIKHSDGDYYVLEDNLRVPSGVSYVLGNRAIMKRTFPDLYKQLGIRPVGNYPLKLREMLSALSRKDNPTVVVLTPGVYNAAYFEHSFLAQEMGVELVEGRDLIVDDGCVKMSTTHGLQVVDVIYRRVDDTFLDPLCFNPDSVLGVAGLMEVYRNGRVALANAPGTGVADDKVIYAYVPRFIEYYLQEEPILQNVPTYLCWEKSQREHVIDNLQDMVVKEADQSGGYGMLMGASSSKKEREEFKSRIKRSPRNYIAQPIMSLSCVPTIVNEQLEGRHVDLRPFVLSAEETFVLPGGLTRVALKKGSLVVNSSQGGGSKDTWVMREKGVARC